MRGLRSLTLALLVGTATARGQTNTWTGAVSGVWNDPANWSDGVPVAGQLILFSSSAAFREIDLGTLTTPTLSGIRWETTGAGFTIRNGTVRIAPNGSILNVSQGTEIIQTIESQVQFEGGGTVSVAQGRRLGSMVR